jgi:hypothetical protein
MTRKHFEAIAEIINCATGDEDTLRELTGSLVFYFENENPRFDRDQFLIACGF